MSGSRFVYVTYIRTTPEKLWQALTEAEFTRQYWCETWQDSAWTAGASWGIKVPDGRVADVGEILEIDPPRRLVVSWRHELSAELARKVFPERRSSWNSRGNRSSSPSSTRWTWPARN